MWIIFFIEYFYVPRGIISMHYLHALHQGIISGIYKREWINNDPVNTWPKVLSSRMLPQLSFYMYFQNNKSIP